MPRKKNPDYETRADLLERIRRQRQTIIDLQMRLRAADEVARSNANLRTVLARLQREQPAGGIVSRLADIVSRFRAAVRTRDGYIGGHRQRALLADIDDDAVQILSSIPGSAGFTEQKTNKEKKQCT